MKRESCACLGTLLLLCLTLPALGQKVIATIKVGSVPVLIAVNRLTNFVYVTNSGDSTVSVIDGAFNTVVATVPVADFPQAVAVDPKLNRIVVGDIGGVQQISVISGRTNSARNVQISPYSAATGLAINSQTSTAYICNTSRYVIALNELTLASSLPILVPSCGLGLNVNPNTNLIYAATFTPNITVVDGSTRQVLSTFPLDLTGVVSLALDTPSNRLGLVDTNAGKFEVVEAATGAVLGTVAGLQRPESAVFETGANKALVTEQTGNDLLLINTDTFSVEDSIPVGTEPIGVDVNPITHVAYVANAGSNTISVIELP